VRLLLIVYAAVLLTGGVTQVAVRLGDRPCGTFLGLIR
jgi:hypothetical protein